MRTDSDIHAGVNGRSNGVRPPAARKEPVRAVRCPVTLMHLDVDRGRRDTIRDFFHAHACFVRDGDDWEAMVEDFRYMSFDALMIGFERALPDRLLASIEELRLSRRVPIVVLCRSVTHEVERIAMQLKALTVAVEPYDLDDIYARLCEALVERDQ